jgi:hypothetical protein
MARPTNAPHGRNRSHRLVSSVYVLERSKIMDKPFHSRLWSVRLPNHRYVVFGYASVGGITRVVFYISM